MAITVLTKFLSAECTVLVETVEDGKQVCDYYDFDNRRDMYAFMKRATPSAKRNNGIYQQY